MGGGVNLEQQRDAGANVFDGSVCRVEGLDRSIRLNEPISYGIQHV